MLNVNIKIMTIFVLDYHSGNCIKVTPPVQVESVEDYLLANEDEFGIRLEDCYYMATENSDIIEY